MFLYVPTSFSLHHRTFSQWTMFFVYRIEVASLKSESKIMKKINNNNNYWSSRCSFVRFFTFQSTIPLQKNLIPEKEPQSQVHMNHLRIFLFMGDFWEALHPPVISTSPLVEKCSICKNKRASSKVLWRFLCMLIKDEVLLDMQKVAKAIKGSWHF